MTWLLDIGQYGLSGVTAGVSQTTKSRGTVFDMSRNEGDNVFVAPIPSQVDAIRGAVNLTCLPMKSTATSLSMKPGPSGARVTAPSEE